MTPIGRASVRVGSLTATPIRRSPTSNPTMRITLILRPSMRHGCDGARVRGCEGSGAAMGRRVRVRGSVLVCVLLLCVIVDAQAPAPDAPAQRLNEPAQRVNEP